MRVNASLLFLLGAMSAAAAVPVTSAPNATPRERFGIERLTQALQSVKAPAGAHVIAGTESSGLFRSFSDVKPFAPGLAEAFHLVRSGNSWLVVGSDPSGVLYGSLELAKLVQQSGTLPQRLDVEDHPHFVLRGPCIGMQKTEVTYDGAIYDYRYTPTEFPFFYNKQLWTRYLDFLVNNRMNTLYLWNGHPFTSLLRLPKYPEAQEISDTQLAENIAMFRWLATEADKRGIWVIQAFYNIHLSHALAKAHNIPFHLNTPTPFASDYTRYCISEFIRNYPNVGLMMTLGEALRPEYGPEWLTKTIIPGVKDGMREAGITKEPPIIVRAHATKIEDAMHQALPLYKNIYTMHKWNGESLTWTNVRGDVLKLHKDLVSLGSTHIMNVHLLSDLEPFRWGSPDFVQKTMQSAEKIGIKGLHLFPLRYWDWPVTADNTQPPLLQMDRDWIWFETWARYAWNPDRDPAAERQYWIARIAEKYGTREAGEKILDAYQLSGVCSPRLLPRIGITEGNRQSFTLGMLMTQLIDPVRYNALTLLWTGDAPPGERLDEWVKREWEKQPHEGETPVGVAAEVVDSATRAVAAAEAAGQYVTRNRDEYLRLLNDMRCIQAMMQYYQAKTNSAALVLRYGYSHDLKDLQRALPLLEQSLAYYKKLVSLTDTTYRQACSVHSVSRRIPFLGGPGRYTHWRDCLPDYEKELATFRANLQRLETPGAQQSEEQSHPPLPGVSVKLSGAAGQLFQVEPGAKVYSDRDFTIRELAPELRGLTGIRISDEKATREGVRLEFESPQASQVLVGFFRSQKRGAAAKPPTDEWEPILHNAVVATGLPAFTVYSHALAAGRNELDLGRGAYIVLGLIRKDAQPKPRMVFFADSAAGARPDLDWLFE
ncbi:MAG TPA: hypothetical protein VG675_11935 [Bryobacteraceae bacterium]|nr:hypothetical protein [Bryobacteraceae bacterium]